VGVGKCSANEVFHLIYKKRLSVGFYFRGEQDATRPHNRESSLIFLHFFCSELNHRSK
jgi:hypothetical protein